MCWGRMRKRRIAQTGRCGRPCSADDLVDFSGVAAEGCVAASGLSLPGAVPAGVRTRLWEDRRYSPLQQRPWGEVGQEGQQQPEPAIRPGRWGRPAGPQGGVKLPRHRSVQSRIAIWIPRHKRKLKWTCRRCATARVGRKAADVRGDRAGVVGGNRRRRVNPDTNGETVPTTRRPGPGIDGGRDEHEKGSRNLTHLACRASILAARPCRMRMGNVGGGAMRRANGSEKEETPRLDCACASARRKSNQETPLGQDREDEKVQNTKLTGREGSL